MVNDYIAYVGLAGPLGYDYVNSSPKLDNAPTSPNPVLENVLGLLLCYDEVYFLSRNLCPADMRNLKYVRFVIEEPELCEPALQALVDADATIGASDPMGNANNKEWDKLSKIILDASPFDRAIDHHTHGILLSKEVQVVGSAMLLENAIRDYWIASTIKNANVDIILSTPAQKSLLGEIDWEILAGRSFSDVKLEAASTLATLKVPNILTPAGSYHDSLEDLRARSDVSEFRSFLASTDADITDGRKLAQQIEQVAFKNVDEVRDRYIKNSGIIQSVGAPAGAAAINMKFPGLGTTTMLLIKHIMGQKDTSVKSTASWAPFVINLHAPPLALER